MKVPHFFRASIFPHFLAGMLSLCLLPSCGGGKDEFRLKGKVRHFREGEFYLYSENGFDTIRVKDFRFDFTTAAQDEGEIRTLLFNNFQQLPIVMRKGVTLKLTTDAKNYFNTDASGDEENKLLFDFMRSNGGLPAARRRQAAAKFIKARPGTAAAEAVWRLCFVESSEKPNADAVKLLKVMLKSRPHDAALTRQLQQLEYILNAQAGRAVPSFKTATLKGDTLTAAYFRQGRHTLITFWADWNYASYNTIRQIRSLRQRHAGRLQTLNVSLNTNRSQCLRTVRRDSVPEPNVCDAQGVRSPLARTFAIQHLPCNILVDGKGIIVGRDLSMDDVNKKIGAAANKP